ncbi:ABC transporter permease [Motilibacter aurantiacus]|uniref:ABC transporter permease n=1 Tax=Motilibacter aurantiacus TaxID=2714955 RepID=UPI001409F39F|nr:ABC transporter permease [Motilibacter aurantiacus]NHC45845.1 ABC transporter permease [Motilibacter aurantiacus]
MDFLDYLADNRDRMLELGQEHLLLVLVALALGTAIGIGTGLLTYRHPAVSASVVRLEGLLLVIPSLAMYALLVPVFGIGQEPVIVALTLYSLLAITRNTVVGLNAVDPAIVESARGTGMGRWRALVRIELPLAWPVIAAGVRVSAILLVSIAALASIVGGGGYGELIFAALRVITGPNALDLVLAGTLGTVAVGLLLDVAFLALTRLTTSKGLR